MNITDDHLIDNISVLHSNGIERVVSGLGV